MIPRPVMKLWKEAERLKSILSANTEASSRVRLALPSVTRGNSLLMDDTKVESVYNDIDFSMKCEQRQVFESTCADMKVRFAMQPHFTMHWIMPI